MDDDGDYFTWTLEETKAALSEEEAAVAALHYDIQEAGTCITTGEECSLHKDLARGDCAAAEDSRNAGGRTVGGGEEEDVCGALAASYTVRRQNDLRRLECDVRVGVSGGGQVLIFRMRGILPCARSTDCSRRDGRRSAACGT